MSGNLVRFPSVKNIAVVDSWPVMEWLKNREPAAAKFVAILADAKRCRVRLVMSTINLGEVYYNCIRVFGQMGADEILARLRASPIEFIHPTEQDAMGAARIKGLYQGAYGDAFAAVLGIEFSAPILTGDPDFLRLRNARLVEVHWMGK